MRLLAALALVLALWTAPALAEKAATGATVPKPADASVKAFSKPVAKPSASVDGSTAKAATQAEMLRAQKASAARDKAWDARTRNSMTSICKGC